MSKFEKNEVWALLRFIGINPCACPELILDETADEKWCFGNREGTRNTYKESREPDESGDDDEKEG